MATKKKSKKKAKKKSKNISNKELLEMHTDKLGYKANVSNKGKKTAKKKKKR